MISLLFVMPILRQLLAETNAIDNFIRMGVNAACSRLGYG
jgi:hypothetical protein